MDELQRIRELAENIKTMKTKLLPELGATPEQQSI